MKVYRSDSLEETQKIATEWIEGISRSRHEALVIGLSGHLGAGKTAFVKAVAKELGITEEITSPTFVIMKMYEIPEPKNAAQTSWPWKRLVHIDAYRLEHREELEALDWEQLVADPHNLILVEWPENAGLNREDGSLHRLVRFNIRDGVHVIEMLQ